MIKSIFLLLKYGSFALINEIIIFFRRFAEVLIIGFDNLNYHIFQTIRLLRFEDVRDNFTAIQRKFEKKNKELSNKCYRHVCYRCAGRKCNSRCL